MFAAAGDAGGASHCAYGGVLGPLARSSTTSARTSLRVLKVLSLVMKPAASPDRRALLVRISVSAFVPATVSACGYSLSAAAPVHETSVVETRIVNGAEASKAPLWP